MARYCGPVCRLCRREGEKLFLKGERCYSAKCAVERREGAPGQHGKGRQSYSDYKTQLREKQKVKRIYGVLERQFKSYFKSAERTKGVKGTALLLNLERRLDNVVYRFGFAFSRRQARQIVLHGHVNVNGKPVNVASYQLSEGDVVEVVGKLKTNVFTVGAMEAASTRIIPEWLILDKSNAKGTLKVLPGRENMPQNVKEQLVVELYSR